MSKAFQQTKAFLDTLRYEEADRLFKDVYKLEKDVRANATDDGEFVWWHKHEDRQMSPIEVYCKALDDVMNLIDERMGVLSAS